MATAADLVKVWKLRFQIDYSDWSDATQNSVVGWLMGENSDQIDLLSDRQFQVIQQSMEFRYAILRQRYLGVSPETAYQNLIRRLSSLVMLRNKIQTWVSLSRDRRRTVVDVVQEIVQELLKSDRYLQQQMAWIARCTTETRLRNALLLTSLEEYCLRPIRNQPLLVYRFVNYLRRSQKGGLTQVPTQELVRIVSSEIRDAEAEDSMNLLDTQTVGEYEAQQSWEEQQALRLDVQQEFATYLAQKVDPMAAQWLQLYLQGRSQEAIAERLKIPIEKVYRLREKVSYHAVRVFAFKHSPELVANWLGTSLQDHSLGLTPFQWQQFIDRLSPTQYQILDRLKAGDSMKEIARALQLKPSQVASEWNKLYLAAQSLRHGL
jgi:DNA-binding CsgD family transcriptional regulator